MQPPNPPLAAAVGEPDKAKPCLDQACMKCDSSSEHKSTLPHQEQQDHQRWGYSTVIHLEQSVYLTTWKDLNKEKRKEHKIKIEPKKWGGWSCVCFFSPPAFEPSALRPYACKKKFQCFKHLSQFWSLGPSWIFFVPV